MFHEMGLELYNTQKSYKMCYTLSLLGISDVSLVTAAFKLKPHFFPNTGIEIDRTTLTVAYQQRTISRHLLPARLKPIISRKTQHGSDRSEESLHVLSCSVCTYTVVY